MMHTVLVMHQRVLHIGSAAQSEEELPVPELLARLHWDNMLSLFSRSDASWMIRSSADTRLAPVSAVQYIHRR